MQLSSVVLARALAFTEVYDLNPRGRVHYPDLVRALVHRYGFMQYPQRPEDFDETKGVKFASGKLGEVTIDQVMIYENGLVLDTRTSTDESERLLIDALEWGARELGLTYRDEMIKQMQYVSQIVFYSNSPLRKINPALNRIAEKVSAFVSGQAGSEYGYDLTGLVINFDQLTAQRKPNIFTIERRASIPFAEDKYFSAAPLPTNKHIELIEELEADLGV